MSRPARWRPCAGAELGLLLADPSGLSHRRAAHSVGDVAVGGRKRLELTAGEAARQYGVADHGVGTAADGPVSSASSSSVSVTGSSAASVTAT